VLCCFHSSALDLCSALQTSILGHAPSAGKALGSTNRKSTAFPLAHDADLPVSASTRAVLFKSCRAYIFHMIFKVPAEHKKAFWVAFWGALVMCALILWVLVR